MTLLKAQRLLARLRILWARARNNPGQIYVGERVDEYRELWRAAATEIGATFHEIAEDIWEVRRDGQKTRIANHLVESDNPVSLHIAGNKPVVHRMLAEHGIPVPEHETYQLHGLEKARRFAERFPGGCVIKPASGTGSGRGVTTHVISAREVRRASVLASVYGKTIMIEPLVPGETCRALVLNGRLIHVARRAGLRLKGDGKSTVRQLMDARGTGGGVDRDCLFTLGYQQLNPDSVPEDGRFFLAKSVDDPAGRLVQVRTVYDEEITDQVGEGFRRVAEQAARAIDAELAGVDMMWTDVTAPPEVCGGVVLEVNTTPGLHHHYDRIRETHPRAAAILLDVLLNRARTVGATPSRTSFVASAAGM